MSRSAFAILITALLATLFLGADAAWTQDEDAEDAKAKAGFAGKGGKGGGKGGGRGKAPTVDESAAKARAIPPQQVLQLAAPNIYLVQQRGANAVFRVAEDGVTLVNSKLPGQDNFDRLLHYIQGVTKQPVKTVTSTGEGPEYTGNHDRFQAMGATILPMKNVVLLDRVAVTGDLDTREKIDALLAMDWDRAIASSGQPLTRAAVEAMRK